MVDAITPASLLAKQQNALGTTPNVTKDAKALSDNYTMFLKLLTTQLQYQDPMNPTDSTTFTQQLVSYSQVEQQIKTNDNLTSLVDASKASTNGGAALLGYLGHYIEVTGDKVALQGGQSFMSYNLATASPNVTVDIHNSDGVKVATFSGAGEAGLQKVSWNGENNDGDILPDGVYTMKVTAKDSEGAPILVTKQSMMGKVSGVERNADGTILSVGGIKVKEADIINVYDSPGDKLAS